MQRRDSASSSSVKFTTVEFHEHAITMGCSLATSHGPPVEIEWEKFNSYTFEINDYEECRPPRRISKQLAMPGDIRTEK